MPDGCGAARAPRSLARGTGNPSILGQRCVCGVRDGSAGFRSTTAVRVRRSAIWARPSVSRTPPIPVVPRPMTGFGRPRSPGPLAASPARPTTAPARPTTAPARPTTAPARPTTAPARPTTARGRTWMTRGHTGTGPGRTRMTRGRPMTAPVPAATPEDRSATMPVSSQFGRQPTMRMGRPTAWMVRPRCPRARSSPPATLGGPAWAGLSHGSGSAVDSSTMAPVAAWRGHSTASRGSHEGRHQGVRPAVAAAARNPMRPGLAGRRRAAARGWPTWRDATCARRPRIRQRRRGTNHVGRPACRLWCTTDPPHEPGSPTRPLSTWVRAHFRSLSR
jgi:hypothetical protein